ncbi:hypothetical protein CPAR01_02791 [Colletotrichum paranaense]|uniref:Uncharacterized protein n=1 Tax=Colletotrichum paranaense TaxID=1914294 RepID=A0ABQ9T1A7_9PEZI|nr:uncharacterized protein CPAR01_02791 [Colletotrichum paranaense]KAK1545289.1 hypothetical protein CPAR01_02791 [Colletotrichum paranaense]
MYGYVPAYRQTNAKVGECYSRLHTKYAQLWVSIRLHDLHDTDGSTLYLCTRSRSHHSRTKDRARARRPHTSPQACQRRRIQPHAPVHLTTRCLLSDRHRTFAAVFALRSVSSIGPKGLAPNSVKASHSFTHSRPQRCARVYVRDGGREKRRQIPSIECGTFKVRLSRKYPTRGERDTETDGEWERKRKCEWTMPKTCMRRRLSLRTRALFLCLCLSLSRARALSLSLFLWSPSSPVPV